MRRQTWGLLALLLAVGVAALVYSPRPGAEVESGDEPQFAAPSPAQLASAMHAIRMPAGFHRSHRCFIPLGREGFCAARAPSLVVTRGLIARLAREAGFTPTPRPLPLGCDPPWKNGLKIEFCGILATLGGQTFLIVATEVVDVRGHVPHSTFATMRDQWGRAALRGVVVNFEDAGFHIPGR